MATLYDDKNKSNVLDGGYSTSDPESKKNSHIEISDVDDEDNSNEQSNNSSIVALSDDSDKGKDINDYQKQALDALGLVDDIVLKNYLTCLSNMEVIPISLSDNNGDEIVLFKINRMVYEKDEYATDKFISAVSAMTFANCSVFLIVDGHKDQTDFYLGIRGEDDEKSFRTIAETFRSSIYGQFPGIQMEDISTIKAETKSSSQGALFANFKEATSVSSCVGIPAYKNSKHDHNNLDYIQGMEKLALAMQGKRYTAIVLASNNSPEEIRNIRYGYENIYTQLSAVATQQIAYSTNESLSNALSRTKGYSDSVSNSISTGKSTSKTTNIGTGENFAKNFSEGESNPNFWARAGKASGPLMTAGAILTATGVGAPLGAALMGAGVIAGAGGIIGEKTTQKNICETKGGFTTNSVGEGVTDTENITEGSTRTESINETDGHTSTIGTSKNFTITIHDKHIEEVLKRIDKQLERIELCESTGLWQTAAYFLSYDTDRAVAETGATIFRSIMQGENSGVETSAINSWYLGECDKSEKQINDLKNSIVNFVHPTFEYGLNNLDAKIQLTGTSLISSKELAMIMGLPRKSVSGLPVIEHVSLAKEVVRHSVKESGTPINIGCIFDQGVRHNVNRVKLDAKSLTQHTFVTGSTGCGKSETIYKLLEEAKNTGATYLIIEPAKGEYKNVFGNANVFGTNPLITKLLHINPFRFPKGVHVLEHIDRLIEIFNVCWPMYAAMPAVLKKATLATYEKCGWNLLKSTNHYGANIFPTFSDLLAELVTTINNSAYSEEVKNNYTGSLVTRVESLTNGINGEIFSSQEIGDKVLFDENTVVDLSRIGSQETKSLIMGILIMRLSEYRMTENIQPNSGLRHITVLEEAHNILKRTSMEQSMEGSNVTGKSVELITNAIAEMRTYGEGFIIVDQSPTSVDQSAIKNTNTKIIMRLPDSDDRIISGKAAGLKNDQIDEIAKLPTGVAVVYQNDWFEPVLCQIDMYKGDRIKYDIHKEDLSNSDKGKDQKADILKFLLKGRLDINVEFSIDNIKDGLTNLRLSTSTKLAIYKAIKEYSDSEGEKIRLWDDDNFKDLSKIVTEIIGVKNDVEGLIAQAKSFEELTSLLNDLVIEKVVIPDYMILVINQTLMKNYGEGSETREKIYNAWFVEAKKQLIK